MDGYNWGYDPWHYTTPEGSYATDPDGTTRIVEYREMVEALNETGLRVVMDVVYNHTTASGQDPKSVLDKVVPGYYHRLDADGDIETSTCCQNTATEHRMMEKLMVDSVVTWAKQYKVDGFRFDLMGHHSKANMLAVRAALDALTLAEDGVDGKSIYLYGEGWNFGEVQNNARFVQATQLNMAGTGIGTFNDRLRDAVRGGGPFDTDPRLQGFATGLSFDPNGADQGDDPHAKLLLEQDQIRVGLTGNLRDYEFEGMDGTIITGADVDYNGSPAGYTDDPQEAITYVDAHDNETLFDALQYKLPADTTMAERVRAQVVGVVDGGARSRRPVHPGRHGAPAIEVARPEQLQLRRLVQHARLQLRGQQLGSRAATGDGQFVEVPVHEAAARRPGPRSSIGRHPGRAGGLRGPPADPRLVAAVPAR